MDRLLETIVGYIRWYHIYCMIGQRDRRYPHGGRGVRERSAAGADKGQTFCLTLRGRGVGASLHEEFHPSIVRVVQVGDVHSARAGDGQGVSNRRHISHLQLGIGIGPENVPTRTSHPINEFPQEPSAHFPDPLYNTVRVSRVITTTH